MSNEIEQKIESLSIGKLFSSENIYRIPLYQRNFAWGRPEVKQLIRDIADFAVKVDYKKYYLGILVVYHRRIENIPQFELVDGQQRLTVLTLLLMAFKNGFDKDETELSMKAEPIDINAVLNFAHRPNAQDTLNSIKKGSIDQLDSSKVHNEIKSVYQEIPGILRQELKEVGCDVDVFYKYLLSHVILYRSPLPDDTELNHYFEVMNNRGEQLEKHEILKAQLLETVREQEETIDAINKIWEYCSDMNRYVQYSFDIKVREKLFDKEWNNPFNKHWYKTADFDEVSGIIAGVSSPNTKNKESINSILKGSDPVTQQPEADNSPDRFQSPINFQNFLLHVLRIYQNQYEDLPDKDHYASLDDKVLLDEFKDYCKDESFVKRFVVLLLKTRFLLDQYVLKREYKGESDHWSLLKLKYYFDRENQKTASYVNTFEDTPENKHVLMLLAMFHVSTPTQNYKHWLTAALNYLVKQDSIEPTGYINHLKLVARKLFFDRFMVSDKEQQVDYESVVFETSESLDKLVNKEIDNDLLTYQQVRNNLVFNYLDYLIWIDGKEDLRIEEFEFRFRSSVEHFNPRNPKEHTPLPDSLLNSFGNLCLIAHGKNSSFGNNSPLSKAYNESSSSALGSLKLYLMMKRAKKDKVEDPDNGGWGPELVKKHEKDMITLFNKLI